MSSTLHTTVLIGKRKKLQAQILRWLCWLLFISYLVSLALPACYLPAVGGGSSGISGHVAYGFEMLVLSLPFALLTVGWWANPLWMMGMYFLAQGHCRRAFLFGLLALIMAGAIFVFGITPPDQFQMSQFYAGFYLWFACHAGLVAVAGLCLE